jgi:uncharacterized membrane protein HdeD (DUF308 family)
MGLATLILGVIVAIHPSVSLAVIAVLLGILLIFSGVFPAAVRAWGPGGWRSSASSA